MYGKHHDRVANVTKVDGVRKPMEYRATRLAVHTLEQRGMLHNATDGRLQLAHELLTKRRLARCVPGQGLDNVRLGLRTK